MSDTPQVQQSKAVSASAAVQDTIEKAKDRYLELNGGDLTAFAAEMSNFMAVVNSTSQLAECSQLSLATAFINAAVDGLSFNPTTREVYLIPYKGVAQYRPSPYGLAKLAVNNGVIVGYSQPEVVFKGESASVVEEGGKRQLKHEIDIFGRDGKTVADVVAVYLYFYMPDGSKELALFTSADWAEWKDPFTGKNNSTSKISMLKAKALRHGLRRLPQAVGNAKIQEYAQYDEIED